MRLTRDRAQRTDHVQMCDCRSHPPSQESAEVGTMMRRRVVLEQERERLRDAGVLGADEAAVSRAPRRSGLTAEQAEIARLKKELAQANSKL